MPKRVLLIATVQSHIAQFHKPLMRMLQAHGWQIHAAARDNLAEKNGLELEYPDRVIDVPFRRSPFDPRNIGAFLRLKKLLREERYDVIHCNTPVGGVLGRLAARPYRKQGTKVFYTVHGFHFYRGAPRISWLLWYPIEKWLARWTDKLIAVDREDYELARARFACEVCRIHGAGADSGRFYPLDGQAQDRQKAALGLSGHILLNVGELVPNKNQRTAILALKALRRSIPDVSLLIAGNGPERRRLERLIEAEGLGASVRMLGYVPHIERYVQVCDALIACSFREGLPLNVTEALLCGKPVVASLNRGHRELIREGENGYLVEADDADGFARRIQRVLSTQGEEATLVDPALIPYTDKNVETELSILYGL